MPLKPGGSHKAMAYNYKELAVNSKTGEPRSREQRIAIMLDEARRTGADIPGPRYGGKHSKPKTGPRRYGGK